MKSRIRVSGFFKLPDYVKIICGIILIIAEIYIISDLIISYNKGVFTAIDFLTLTINLIVLVLAVKILLDGIMPGFLELNDKYILLKKYSFLPVRKISYNNINKIYKTTNSVNLDIKDNRKIVFPKDVFTKENQDRLSAFVTIANQKISYYKN